MVAYRAYDYSPDRTWRGVEDSAQEFEISKKSKEQQCLLNATLSADFCVFSNNV
jgi:hypothetical protein